MAIERIIFHPPIELDIGCSVEDQITGAISRHSDDAIRTGFYADLTPEESRGSVDFSLFINSLTGNGEIVIDEVNADGVSKKVIHVPEDSAVVPIIGKRKGKTLMHSVVYYNPYDEDLV